MKYSVLDYLEQTAQAFPDKIAFADVNTKVSWKDFVEEAKRLSTVIEKYYAPQTAVPIMMEKSVKTLEYFFAALYAGCFYSYFDATFPSSRLNSMVDTLGAQHIISENRFAKNISAIHIQPLFQEQIENEVTNYSDARRNAIIDTDIVYANFTSGSTGIPKAVVVSHRSLIDFMFCFTEIFTITSQENIANQAPFDFDVSVKDIFSAVFTGATTHLIPKLFFSFPTKLLDYLEERQITTIIWAVSAMCIISTLNGFTYKVPSKLKKIMFSGEVMPVKHLHIWQNYLPNAEYVNLYGPTEITCNCTYYRINKFIPEDAVIPIGKPFPNERVFLLDDADKLITSPNVEGELCVSGTCVASGYCNSEKTKDVFIQNPLQNLYFERIYKTGDLAKYDEQGDLIYVGRKDAQIKHMGHRIELSEIESVIAKHSDVTRACCIYADNKITAFYTGNEIEKKALVLLIKNHLPQYMIPSDFIFIKEFPLTKNGKIDKKAMEALLA